MYCNNCGARLSDNSKFCNNCGNQVDSVSASGNYTMQLKCKNCGGVMSIDPNRQIMSCPYCDSRELMVESDNVKIQNIKSKAYTAVENTKNFIHRDIEYGKLKTQKDIEKIKANKETFDQKIGLILFASSFMFLLALLGFASCMAEEEEKERKNKIEITVSDSDFWNVDYKEAVAQFEDMGFTDIETKGNEDLINGWIVSENSVDKITINGDEDFSEGDFFDKDAKVRIYYHSFEKD